MTPRSDSLTSVVPRHGLRRDVATLCIVVFAGYYLGARLGLALTFYPTPVSVLWPPNAILFAAMLVVPARSWGYVVAAALPAHLLAELQSGVPPGMVVCWFVSNVTEALIGAVGMRWVLGRTPTFEHVRDVNVFLVVAVVATFLSSFVDSAFVVLNAWGGRTYWEVWKSRLLSNITASLVFVPVIVVWQTVARRQLADASPRRIAEACALLALLLAVSVLAFDAWAPTDAPPVLLYLPLPFLLWAALRFGVVGASTAFAVVALLVIWGAGHGTGPFAAGLPRDNALSVQVFLVFVGPTLLWLAAALAERRNAERSLRMSDRRFQLVLEATKDAVYDREMPSDTLWWSRNALQPFGYGSRDRPANFSSLAELVHADDRQRLRRAHADAIAGGQPHWQTEYRLRKTDGTYAHVNEQGFIVRDASGDPRQMVGTLTDITERHDTEELNQRLAHASRLTAMGELSASIAHEINQPMAAILMNVDAAEMLLDDGRFDEGELRRILDDIRSDDVRASEVIRHMRALVNHHESAFERFDVNELVRSVVRLIHPTTRRHGVSVVADSGTPTPVRGDRILIQQVLLNLLLNAVDAMAATPENERTIRVAVSRPDSGWVTVSVSDCGRGIAAEHLGRIFESFFTTKPNGMGMGLSIARTLVQRHGGRIWAENNAGGGATCSFTLPTEPSGTE